MGIFSSKKTYSTAQTITDIDTDIRTDTQSIGVSGVEGSQVLSAKQTGDITFVDEGAVEKSFALAEAVSEREHDLLKAGMAQQHYQVEAVTDIAATATENIAAAYRGASSGIESAYAQAKEKIDPQMILYASLGVVALFGFILLKKG